MRALDMEQQRPTGEYPMAKGMGMAPYAPWPGTTHLPTRQEPQELCCSHKTYTDTIKPV